jgi:hypothetical protein
MTSRQESGDAVQNLNRADHRYVTESARYRERSTPISSEGIGLFLNSVFQELSGFIATLVRNRAEHECFEIE